MILSINNYKVIRIEKRAKKRRVTRDTTRIACHDAALKRNLYPLFIRDIDSRLILKLPIPKREKEEDREKLQARPG